MKSNIIFKYLFINKIYKTKCNLIKINMFRSNSKATSITSCATTGQNIAVAIVTSGIRPLVYTQQSQLTLGQFVLYIFCTNFFKLVFIPITRRILNTRHRLLSSVKKFMVLEIVFPFKLFITNITNELFCICVN